ncbi:MAG: MBL fold metallo-hydrolase [Actinobacteria bacterium]|nr:MBL fold metallo-hydrolase [Actinomycetota bacterium]
MTPHWADERLEVHRHVVGPVDNNVFVIRCKETGDGVMIDAANEHDLLLELCQTLGVRTVLETHGHWDHIQAVEAVRNAGYEVGVTAEDAGMLPSYDYLLEDETVIEIGRLRIRTHHTPGHTPESISIVVYEHADDDEALHSIGRPRPGVEADIRDENGDPLPDGEVGELWLTSPAVMSGYWNDPAGTAETLVDGWLRTGDLATRDDNGIFRLRGRVKEMFIRGGYNVYPMEVEGVLLDHPAVAEIVLVPRPDPVMGEIGVAVIVPVDPSAPPTLDDLRVHGEATLAHHKLPEAIRVVAELPRNASDKIDRRALARVEAEHPST